MLVCRCCCSAMVLWAAALSAPLCAAQSPTLRYTTYLLVGAGSEPVAVRLESQSYGSRHADFVYKDQPRYVVLDHQGNPVEELEGRLGQPSLLTVPVSSGPFHLLELAPGNNYVQAHLDAPYALVATASAPLRCVGGFERHYFFVPRGLSAAALFFHAFSVREAGRVVIYDPQGKTAAEVEGDFNEPTVVPFEVPAGQDGMVWSVALVKPRDPAWVLDDCTVWLGGTLPGLLAPRSEWAGRLSRPFVLTWRPVLGFEQEGDIASAAWDRPAPDGLAPSLGVAVSSEKPHRGGMSLRVALSIPAGYADGNMVKVFTRTVPAEGCRRVAFWLYGDSSGRTLQVRVRDQHQEHFYAPPLTIDWEGWQEVLVDFGGGGVTASGGDANQRIDGPGVSLVFQIRHAPGQPLQSVYYIDDVALSP